MATIYLPVALLLPPKLLPDSVLSSHSTDYCSHSTDRKVCLSHLNSLEKKGLDAEKLSVVNSLTSILAATDAG
ncbi:HEATR6 [Bugula neritina]|uniref:HEATR6 n=1 Tax=Bugula neritina TaxID=10212 RepID=A0A7J7JQM7_BUGNE|nr:HEATR6 [Bugula neritina]